MIEIITNSSISVKAERTPARAIERRVCVRLDFIADLGVPYHLESDA